MFFIYVGIILAVCKFLKVEIITDFAWWQIAIPFVLAFIYWELFETLFGFDRRNKVKDDHLEARKARIKDSWKKKR